MHVVLVNEKGGNLGHLMPLVTLGRALKQQRYRVTLVVPDLLQTDFLLQLKDEFNIIQAPSGHFNPADPNMEPASFSEVLLLAGYTQIERLAIAIQAWHNLLTLLAPSTVVFDYAPTAQLASANLPFTKINIGSGFCVAPGKSPLPAYFKVPTKRVERSDQLLLDNVNKALGLIGWNTYSQTHKMFAADITFVTGLPELDCYRVHRTTEVYCGVFDASQNEDNLRGEKPIWAGSRGKPKVFAYLNTQLKTLESLIGFLCEHTDCNVFITGHQSAKRYEELRKKFEKRGFISDKPLDMTAVLASCDIVVGHGGHTLTAQSVQAQKPVILLPLQTEQKTTALLVKDLRLGFAVATHAAFSEQAAHLEHAFNNIDSLQPYHQGQICQDAKTNLNQVIRHITEADKKISDRC